MNRKWLAGITISILALGLTALRAQAPPDATSGPIVIISDGDAGPETAVMAADTEFAAPLPFPLPDPQGPQGGIAFVGPGAKDNITFVRFEAGLGNRVVTGAPYSAQVTSEFEQTLADGNKIDRKTVTTVYRDGQGRTRREQTLPAIGRYSATDAPKAIFINDPVAGVSYVLDPTRKTARKIVMPKFERGPGRGGKPPLPKELAGPKGPGGGNGPRRQNANITTESLGSQNIEGVLVQGTRVTRTIPAGTVGNQDPIQVTSERWYSPDLQLNLLVKNVDPLRGTNTTTLSNISRAEADPTLFQVPSDYTIQDASKGKGPRGFNRKGPAPPPAPPQ
jgi:hypothetical protein